MKPLYYREIDEHTTEAADTRGDRWRLRSTTDTHTVSTIFLATDHGWEGLPVLWETMVFPRGSWTEIECVRYTSRAEAREGHATMAAKYAPGAETVEDAV